MEFVLDYDAMTPDGVGGGITDITAVPADLVKLFGYPHPSPEGYKISGEFIFRPKHDDPRALRLQGISLEHPPTIFLHDWKATRLYNYNYPLPEDFWTTTLLPITFDISGYNWDVGYRFKKWLEHLLRTT